MKVQSKVSIFSMAFVVACAMGVATDAHAGIFRSKGKYAQDQRDKAEKSWQQIDENGGRRGVGYVAKKTAKAIKAQMKADATQAEIDASLAASEEARRRYESSRTTTVETQTTKTTTASTEIDLSQSPLFVDPVNGRCPDGYAEMSDGSCGNTYFRHRGPCADQGKGDLGQGKGDLGQGKGDLGQGKSEVVCTPPQVRDPATNTCVTPPLDCTGKFLNVAENKCEDIPDCTKTATPSTYNATTNKCEATPDPVCVPGKTHLENHKCVPDEHKHVDPVKPVRTKTECEGMGRIYYVDKNGIGRCGAKIKKEETKKVEPKKEQPKKVEPKKEEPKQEEPKKVEPKKEEVKKEECHDPCGIKEVKKEECHDSCGQKTVQNDDKIFMKGNFLNKEVVNQKKGILGLNKIFGRKRKVGGEFSGYFDQDKALDLIEGNYLTANNRKKALDETPAIGKYEAEYNEKYGVQKTGGTAN